MNGSGIVRGMWITFRHLLETYIEDFRKGPKHYYTQAGIEDRRSANTKGIFSVQYPEEKLPVPENFRYIPFLVYNEDENGKKIPLCTSCGICAKVCPPQCISIKRSVDPETGRPVPIPVEFYIDIDICMNCGFCAEFCPFDAIKMDHDYELATTDRLKHHMYDMERLLKPVEYYAKIRPTYYAEEEAVRKEKEAAKNLKNNPIQTG
jgi:NADH-quinone oxidoreductase subunit I